MSEFYCDTSLIINIVFIVEDNNKQNYILSDQTLGVPNTEERFSS